ncbi:MAG TPA: ester cyclase [Acidimicrobiales bacterium]|nr:ester cyclase [Acidimicrobiales bacterium]
MSDDKRDVLAAAVDAWNAGDGEEYLKLYDPSIVHHGLAPEPFDQVANRGFYEALWVAFPGAQLNIDDTISEADRLALRFHLVGEHKGEFMGVPATGRAFRLNAQTIMRFRNGRVVERWTTGDTLGLLTQLGALPGPSA